MSIIAKNITFLRKQRGLTQEQIADDLEIKAAKQGSYEESRAYPPIPMLIKYSDYFKLPIDIMVRHDLTKSDGEPSIVIGNNRILFPMMVSENDRDMIEVVPVKASAGYLNGYADPEYIESLECMKLPFMPVGKHRAFPITGDSMLPIKDGSYIVGKYLEGLNEINDGKTYILLTTHDGIVYKRVYNKIQEDGTLHLHSDNKVYQPYQVKAEDVLEIWEFTCQVNTQEYDEEELNLNSVFSMLRELKVELAEIKNET